MAGRCTLDGTRGSKREADRLVGQLRADGMRAYKRRAFVSTTGAAQVSRRKKPGYVRAWAVYSCPAKRR